MSLDGWIAWVVLALPLIGLVVVAWRSTRRARRRAAPIGVLSPHAAPPLAPPVKLNVPRSEPVPPPVAVPQPPPVLVEDRRASEQHLLPTQYLAMARDHIRAGALGPARLRLAECVQLAVQLDMRSEHAAARVELGDLALRDGDLTSACEHWQIARSVFAELGQPHARDDVLHRMEKSRCPTDWVLNQF